MIYESNKMIYNMRQPAKKPSVDILVSIATSCGGKVLRTLLITPAMCMDSCMMMIVANA